MRTLVARFTVPFAACFTSCLTARRTVLAATAASILLLTACGGGEEDRPATASISAMPARTTIAALLDDEGNVTPPDPAAVPADPGAQTRTRRYATAAQAEQLEHAMGDRAISLRVEPAPDAAGAVALAMGTAHGLQAAHDLDRHVPLLVRGSDLRLAASLADRLTDDGYTRVILVTP